MSTDRDIHIVWRNGDGKAEFDLAFKRYDTSRVLDVDVHRPPQIDITVAILQGEAAALIAGLREMGWSVNTR
jgi:hypothetical protein